MCCWFCGFGCVFVGCGFVVFVSCVLVGFVVVCLLVFCVFAGFGVYFAFVFAGFVAALLVVDMFFLLLAVAFLFCCPLHAFSVTLFLFSLLPCLLFRFHFFMFTAFLIRIRLKHLQGIFHTCKQERSGAVVSMLGS